MSEACSLSVITIKVPRLKIKGAVPPLPIRLHGMHGDDFSFSSKFYFWKLGSWER